MNIWLFILILIFSVWIWLKHTKSKPIHKHPTSGSSTRTSKSYHGVSIQPCLNACQAVSQFKGKRFLASEVTALPVHGCTAKKCTCTYIHYEDRRSKLDRRYRGVSIRLTDVPERHNNRSGRDRRWHGLPGYQSSYS